MKNDKKSPKIPYSAMMSEMEKWSFIHIQLRKKKKNWQDNSRTR